MPLSLRVPGSVSSLRLFSDSIRSFQVCVPSVLLAFPSQRQLFGHSLGACVSQVSASHSVTVHLSLPCFFIFGLKFTDLCGLWLARVSGIFGAFKDPKCTVSYKKENQPLNVPAHGTNPRVTIPDSQTSPPWRNPPSLRGLDSGPDERHWNESPKPQDPQRREEKARALCIIYVFLPCSCELLRKQPREVPISEGLTASRPSGSQGNHALVDHGIFSEHEPRHKYTAERPSWKMYSVFLGLAAKRTSPLPQPEHPAAQGGGPRLSQAETQVSNCGC